MNLNNSDEHKYDQSEYWSNLHKEVMKLIKEKIASYKEEIELTLELKGFKTVDVGKSVKYLSDKAPHIYLNKRELKIEKTPYTFYSFKKTKKVSVDLIINKKVEILSRYNKKASDFGFWANREFYPKVFNNLKFIVDRIMAKEYTFVKVRGDIDIILTPIQSSNSKIFVDVKNTLRYYTNSDLFVFYDTLRKFNFKIIPIVIARKIYDDPKEKISRFGGDFIEMEKVLIPSKYKTISDEFNTNIVQITRIIPKKLIHPDIKERFEKLKKLNEGINFLKTFPKISKLRKFFE